MLQAETKTGWEGWTPKAWVLGPNDSSGQASRCVGTPGGLDTEMCALILSVWIKSDDPVIVRMLGLLILMMSRLRDGPFILESLGSELGHFPLLQAIGASRWTPHFRCVRLKTDHLSLLLGYIGSDFGPLPYS